MHIKNRKKQQRKKKSRTKRELSSYYFVLETVLPPFFSWHLFKKCFPVTNELPKVNSQLLLSNLGIFPLWLEGQIQDLCSLRLLQLFLERGMDAVLFKESFKKQNTSRGKKERERKTHTQTKKQTLNYREQTNGDRWGGA